MPNLLLPEFDFSEALSMAPIDRLDATIAKVRQENANWVSRYPGDVRPIPPDAAAEEELWKLEEDSGAELPAEYRQFLLRARYYSPIEGLWVHGVARPLRDGLGDCDEPWLSDKHVTGKTCWVVGEYGRCADGDQLLIFQDDPSQKVILYLHEHGPAFETYAPSFSLALWRMAHEGTEDEDE